MVSYGIYYALGLCAAGVVITWLLSWPFAIPFYLLAAFCLNFFRDPDRVIPAGPYAVSPADDSVETSLDTAGQARQARVPAPQRPFCDSRRTVFAFMRTCRTRSALALHDAAGGCGHIARQQPVLVEQLFR